MAGGSTWDDAANAQLLDLAARGMPWEAIGGRMDRSDESVRWRYHHLLGRMTDEQRGAEERLRQASRRPARPPSSLADAEQMVDRDARASLSHRDITAAFFGDPLPGRSALDQLRSGEAR